MVLTNPIYLLSNLISNSKGSVRVCGLELGLEFQSELPVCQAMSGESLCIVYSFLLSALALRSVSGL